MVLLDDPEFDIGTPQLSEAALEQRPHDFN